jgi:hypothetical protein
MPLTSSQRVAPSSMRVARCGRAGTSIAGDGRHVHAIIVISLQARLSVTFSICRRIIFVIFLLIIVVGVVRPLQLVCDIIEELNQEVTQFGNSFARIYTERCALTGIEFLSWRSHEKDA